jgi:hypothetical protein
MNNYDMYIVDIPGCLYGKTRNEIEYKSDIDVYGKNYWQYPSETLNLKQGDCEDKALLMIAVYYTIYGKKTNMVQVDTNNDGINNHVVWEEKVKHEELKSTANPIVYTFDAIKTTIIFKR